MWIPLVIISASLWGLTGVLESVLTHRYEDHPVVLMWSVGLFRILPIGLLYAFTDISTQWWPYLLSMGMLYFVGGVCYFFVMKRLDVSVLNAAWAVQAIIITALSFLLLGESWNLQETLGSILILSGVFFLSYYHRHVSVVRTLLLLVLVGLFFIPEIVFQKYLLNLGESVWGILFWGMVGTSLCSLIFPLLYPKTRKRILQAHRLPIGFFIISFLGMCSASLAMLFEYTALARGPLSLISTVWNVQIFMVLLIAWIFCRFLPPKLAPRELLTVQSVTVKLASFSLFVVGLGLIAL